MVGRPKIFDEDVVLEKAMKLFWEQGYGATSTEMLLDAIKINKGSLYNSFKSKKSLYLKVLDVLETKWLNGIECELSKSEKPIQVIKDIFLSIARDSYDGHMNGCLLGNTLVELSNRDNLAVNTARKHLKRLELIFCSQIKKSQQSGELKTKLSAELLAVSLVNLWNGLNITRRLHPDKEILMRLIELNLEILK